MRLHNVSPPRESASLDVYCPIGANPVRQLHKSGNTHAMKPNHLPREVARLLGPYYVYALVDARDNTIFYVGKGTGARPLAHGLTIAGAYAL